MLFAAKVKKKQTKKPASLKNPQTRIKILACNDTTPTHIVVKFEEMLFSFYMAYWEMKKGNDVGLQIMI